MSDISYIPGVGGLNLSSLLAQLGINLPGEAAAADPMGRATPVLDGPVGGGKTGLSTIPPAPSAKTGPATIPAVPMTGTNAPDPTGAGLDLTGLGLGVTTPAAPAVPNVADPNAWNDQNYAQRYATGGIETANTIQANDQTLPGLTLESLSQPDKNSPRAYYAATTDQGGNGGTIYNDPGAKVQLIDPANGQVVAEGDAQHIASLASAISQKLGKKATWDIAQETAPGSGKFITSFGDRIDKPRFTLLSALKMVAPALAGALLGGPVGGALFSGLGSAAGAAGSALTAGATGLLTGQSPTQALLDAVGAGGGSVLGSALRGAGTAAGGAAGGAGTTFGSGFNFNLGNLTDAGRALGGGLGDLTGALPSALDFSFGTSLGGALGGAGGNGLNNPSGGAGAGGALPGGTVSPVEVMGGGTPGAGLGGAAGAGAGGSLGAGLGGGGTTVSPVEVTAAPPPPTAQPALPIPNLDTLTPSQQITPNQPQVNNHIEDKLVQNVLNKVLGGGSGGSLGTGAGGGKSTTPDPFTPGGGSTGGGGTTPGAKPGTGGGTPDGTPPTAVPSTSTPSFRSGSTPQAAGATGSPFGGGGAGPGGLGDIHLKGSAAPDIYPWSTVV